MLITGTRKGIGKYLAEYYIKKGFKVIGCSRKPIEFTFKNYQHFCLDITDEQKVKDMFSKIKNKYGRLDILINNAGISSMNLMLLTPMSSVLSILNTNVGGTFLFCREASRLMRKSNNGRIINF